ncbi:hypothetical protein GCM10008927_20220 [Amylibacter ulvae]|uniref:AAA+ family ATPase n=1 Tax=Paramylibacter ulvae TaxID=1651968 RepID=A0ABQ3D2M7_9RHOB|nr:hypothetical protein [Amylibacter ulvae]GHA54372.1 hypothetical protein GCM10008927_20220 [Amylibacter ulvae]
MKTRFAILCALALQSTPTAAQEKPADRLMELLELFSQEAPAILEDMIEEFAPSLEALRDQIGDLNYYETPEVLPNGDIIIRRKPDAPEPKLIKPEPPKEQIEL